MSLGVSDGKFLVLIFCHNNSAFTAIKCHGVEAAGTVLK